MYSNKNSTKLQCGLLGTEKNYVLIGKFTNNFNCTRVTHRSFTGKRISSVSFFFSDAFSFILDTWFESEVRQEIISLYFWIREWILRFLVFLKIYRFFFKSSTFEVQNSKMNQTVIFACKAEYSLFILIVNQSFWINDGIVISHEMSRVLYYF